MSRFSRRAATTSDGTPRFLRTLLSWRVVLGLGLALLLSLASGVWASPQQHPPRQTVPTRTPTDAPAPTDAPTETPTPTDTPEPTNVPPTEVPATPDEGDEEATSTPRPTSTPQPGPTRPPAVSVASVEEDVWYVLLEDKEALARYVPPTPTPSPTPTPLPNTLPQELVGKIAFKSDYFGRTRFFLVDPDGGKLALLVKSWVYEAAAAADKLSPDGRYHIRQGRGDNGIDLFVGAVSGGAEKRLTFVGHGKAYDWAWAPDGRHIAFASNQENDDDLFVVEIWTPEDPFPKTTNLTPSDGWASDKHPSYSPDGSQIVFYSNRSGRDQLWLMDADGSNPRQLLSLDGDCWDPVWLK